MPRPIQSVSTLPPVSRQSSHGAPPCRFDKLESLRGIAACAVAIHHSPFAITSEPGAFVASSYLFVDLFFMLSGFVMTHAYRDRILRGLPFRRYAALRLARLYPLHVVTHFLFLGVVLAQVAVYSFGVGSTDPATSLHLSSFWTNLMLLQALGIQDYLYWNRPSWSISAELLAYVAFFVLTRTLDRAGRLLPPLIAGAAIYSALLVYDTRRLDVTYDFGGLRCVAGFYLGSFLYRLHGRTTTRHAKTRLFQTAAEFVAVAVAVVGVTFSQQGSIFIVAALSAFAAIILVFTSSSTGLLGTALQSRALHNIGLWSYSIYLLHLICFDTAGDVAEYGVGLRLSTGVGWLAIPLNAAVLGLIIILSKYSYERLEIPCRDQLVRQTVSPPASPARD
jgi:peptidoglycan/LPS O-acetylase OafA/YrhL